MLPRKSAGSIFFEICSGVENVATGAVLSDNERRRNPHGIRGQQKRFGPKQEHKRIPNSLGATIRAIRVEYKLRPNEGLRKVEHFKKTFETAYGAVIEHFPGNKAEATNLGQYIENMERGEKDLRYYELRTYAEIVGIPVGLLLAYSELARDASNGSNKEELLDTISAYQKALEALRREVQSSEAAEGFMIADVKEVTGQPGVMIYRVRVEGLAIMSWHFREYPYRLVKTNDL